MVEATTRTLVIVDACAIDWLAAAGINPVLDLRDTEFELAYSPDLRTEYENGLDHITDAAKIITRDILKEGKRYGFFGFGGAPCLGLDHGIFAAGDQYEAIDSIKVVENERGLPRKRTDAHLVALAKNAIVLTNNRKEGHWRRNPEGPGAVIQISDFTEYWEREHNFASALRAYMLDRALRPQRNIQVDTPAAECQQIPGEPLRGKI
jgi:hypothetical protein